MFAAKTEIIFTEGGPGIVEGPINIHALELYNSGAATLSVGIADNLGNNIFNLILPAGTDSSFAVPFVANNGIRITTAGATPSNAKLTVYHSQQGT